MIAISAYTEPVPVNITPEEPQKPREDEESSESSAFAELLAGLLRSGSDEVSEDQVVSFYEGGEAAGEILPFEIAREAGDFSELDLFEIGLSREQPDLLTNLDDQDLNPDILDGFLRNLSINENTEGLAALEQDASFPADNENDGLAVRTAASSAEAAALADAQNAAKNAAELLRQELSQNITQGNAAAQAAAETAAANAAAAGKEAAALKSNEKSRTLSKTEDTLSAKDARGEDAASLRTEPGKESVGRLDELRSRSKRDRVTFEVRDFRTGTAADSQSAAETRINAGADVSAGRVQAAPSNEITLDLRLPQQGQSPLTQAQTSWEVKAGGAAVENMLARELHQSFNGDIVRHASMALHDGGKGTIKIALHPESLGNVKIHLEMTENKITGQIVVESEEALNAFRKELASLEQAFRDSGYTNADLNLSLAAEGRNAQWNEQEANSPTPRNVASRYDDLSRDSTEQDALLVDVLFGRKPGSINLLA